MAIKNHDAVMRKLSAELIITNSTAPLKNHHIVVSDVGEILHIRPNDGSRDIEHYDGIITPGFVNAHCHLELSHLQGEIQTGTGLIPFIKGVVTLRDFPQDIIDQKIKEADLLMLNNGIVAVGDISNKIDTKGVKDNSPICYYTFVEMFDFLQEESAQTTFENYMEVYNQQSVAAKNKKSVVPHAPYSVSQKLFSLINQTNDAQSTVSIHNQELAAENELFLNKTGAFIDFYRDFDISLDRFEPIGQNSIRYAIDNMDPNQKTLFVHNTQTNIADIERAHGWSDYVYWVTCPNANLYIENKLPRYERFINSDARLCIGTDSLSSNWTLCILSEMMTIKKYQSFVDDLEIIRWATINGASALGYDNQLGSIEIGKTPGLNLIDIKITDEGFNLSEAKGVKKLI